MYILESSSIILYLFWMYENTIDMRYPKAKEIKRIFRDILLYIFVVISVHCVKGGIIFPYIL